MQNKDDMNNNADKSSSIKSVHRKNHRYKDYDYSSDGYYFVTICTDKQRFLFGDVYNCEVELNSLGQIVENNINSLNDLPGVCITSYIVMPNHLHMLIEIANYKNKTKWILSELVIRLKSKVILDFSRQIKETGRKEKIWQRNYWDYIVRKESELTKIIEYITRNAEFWDLERESPENEYHSIDLK
jgi:putative transposase